VKINGVECTFHHMGIPTAEARSGERFNELLGMYTSDSDCASIHIQWHRFTAESPLHPLIRTRPHLGFSVVNLDRAISGCNVLLGPYEPIPGLRVAIIEDGSHPIELLEVQRSHETASA
jgi:hypothetical protein